jgi:hypothetical protein
MLYEEDVLRQWARRDRTKLEKWAPLPPPPVVKEVIPTSEKEPADWQYTTEHPDEKWNFPATEVDWKKGPAGFGTQGTPGAVVRTEWNTSDIWLRREFTIVNPNAANLEFRIHHDEDAEVYIDGKLAARLKGYTVDYERVPIRRDASLLLRPGKHLIAIHCHQQTGGQYIDAGIVELTPATP